MFCGVTVMRCVLKFPQSLLATDIGEFLVLFMTDDLCVINISCYIVLVSLLA